MRELLTLEIGQAGLQIGHALWELMCLEHGITPVGFKSEVRDMYGNLTEENNPFEYKHVYFTETPYGKFVPRAILFDMEPTVMDEIRSGSYRQLWNPQNLISGKEDAGSNFARGHFTAGKLYVNSVLDSIRKQSEKCDHLSSFQFIHSHDGGTGSGFTSLLAKKLCDDYGKVNKFSFGLYPSPRISEVVVSPFNTMLHSHTAIDAMDVAVLLDNEAMYGQCVSLLGVDNPTFTTINRIIAQTVSAIFMGHRFHYSGSLKTDICEILTNLVPFPRIHFPFVSFAPICSPEDGEHSQNSVAELTDAVFTQRHSLLSCPMNKHKFISCTMLYRGATNLCEIYRALAKVKDGNFSKFVEWCPTGFKIAVSYAPPIQVPGSPHYLGSTTLCMVFGNCGIMEAIKCVNRKFDSLFQKRAFVHHFVGEGLEEGEFPEARENISKLARDYDEIEQDLAPDEEDNENIANRGASNPNLKAPSSAPSKKKTASSTVSKSDRVPSAKSKEEEEDGAAPMKSRSSSGKSEGRRSLTQRDTGIPSQEDIQDGAPPVTTRTSSGKSGGRRSLSQRDTGIPSQEEPQDGAPPVTTRTSSGKSGGRMTSQVEPQEESNLGEEEQGDAMESPMKSASQQSGSRMDSGEEELNASNYYQERKKSSVYYRHMFNKNDKRFRNNNHSYSMKSQSSTSHDSEEITGDQHQHKLKTSKRTNDRDVSVHFASPSALAEEYEVTLTTELNSHDWTYKNFSNRVATSDSAQAEGKTETTATTESSSYTTDFVVHPLIPKLKQNQRSRSLRTTGNNSNATKAETNNVQDVTWLRSIHALLEGISDNHSVVQRKNKQSTSSSRSLETSQTSNNADVTEIYLEDEPSPCNPSDQDE